MLCSLVSHLCADVTLLTLRLCQRLCLHQLQNRCILHIYIKVLDKQLQHTLQLGYIPHVEVKSVSAQVRVAIAEVSHSVKLVL
jgi:hypothetical protein